MALKVGIIGPTNLQKLSKLIKKPVKFFLGRAEKIGELLAEAECELWVNLEKFSGEAI